MFCVCWNANLWRISHATDLQDTVIQWQILGGSLTPLFENYIKFARFIHRNGVYQLRGKNPHGFTYITIG